MITNRICTKCHANIIIYNQKNVACPFCYPNYRKNKNFVKKVCRICGNIFYTNNTSKKTCSIKCQRTKTRFDLNKFYYFKVKNKFTCKRCGKQIFPNDTTHRLHAHHKIPKEFGGTDNQKNIICLCSGCHAFVHRYPNKNKKFITIP